MDALIDPLFQALGAALGMALTALVVLLLKKVGLSVDADRTAKIEYYAQQAATFAEEQAAAYAKKHLVKMEAGQKLQIATAKLLSKVPGVNANEAQDVIIAALPGLRLGAAAGGQKLGEALRTPR
jgi:hypothetical protein